MLRKMSIKKLLTMPYNATLDSLNYIQDKVSSQPKTETFNNVKIQDELKECVMSFEELVMSKGFPLEIHYTETEDGYVLKLYRIPAGKGESNFKMKQKQSVLLVHGIFDSSDGWVCNSEDKCIPFILVNLGYDVWLSNSRGNKHSRFHKKYSPDNFEFWDFSFHEMGMYDLPSILNHVTKINVWSEQVIYIGHSQGTAQLFSGLTQNLEYFQTKIKLFIAMGPVARCWNMNSRLLKWLSGFKFDKIFEKLGIWEIFASDEKLSKLNSWVMPKIPYLCSLISNMICDVNAGASNNKKMMPVYLSHNPGGSSLKAITHFMQLARKKDFCNYDYGSDTNKVIYGTVEPKEYDLKAIHDIPIGLFCGMDDKLSNPIDCEWLHTQLANNVIACKTYKNMGHTTFMMANDMNWFNDVIEVMDLYL